jgi:phospholipase C
MQIRFTFKHVNLAASLLALSLSVVQTAKGQTVSNTSTPIQHVVVIFQENVSFDHYFATYPNAANPGGEPIFIARKGAHPTPTVNGLTGPLMAHNPNSVQPFRMDRSQAIVCDQSHDYTGEQKALDGGLMDRFVELDGTTQTGCNDLGLGKGPVISCYDGNTVTALWNYAKHFAEFVDLSRTPSCVHSCERLHFFCRCHSACAPSPGKGQA